MKFSYTPKGAGSFVTLIVIGLTIPVLSGASGKLFSPLDGGVLEVKTSLGMDNAYRAILGMKDGVRFCVIEKYAYEKSGHFRIPGKMIESWNCKDLPGSGSAIDDKGIVLTDLTEGINGFQFSAQKLSFQKIITTDLKCTVSPYHNPRDAVKISISCENAGK